jgi:hypothetical protein
MSSRKGAGCMRCFVMDPRLVDSVHEQVDGSFSIEIWGILSQVSYCRSPVNCHGRDSVDSYEGDGEILMASFISFTEG